MKSILKLSALALFVAVIAITGCRKFDKHDKKDCGKRYDCKELKLNFKDKCKTKDGTEGYVNKDCKCEAVKKEERKYDCEELKSNIGDPCKTAAGVGIIDKNCDCIIKKR